MTKIEVITRLNAIADEANSHDNGYHYEVVARDWANYGKNRTYFSIVETRDNSKHYVKKDYGFYDNNADEYVAGKANIEYDFGGNHKIEIVEETENEAEAETETIETTENEEEITMKKFTVETPIIENETVIGWDADAVLDYVEATDAEEAMDFAKDYLRDCIINNGGDPDEEEIVLRIREVIDTECGDYGEWVYG